MAPLHILFHLLVLIRRIFVIFILVSADYLHEIQRDDLRLDVSQPAFQAEMYNMQSLLSVLDQGDHAS